MMRSHRLFRPLRILATGSIVAGILCFSDARLRAQAPAAPLPPPPPPGPPPKFEPSRYVSPEEVAAHVTKVSDQLAMRQRVLDPFGRNQDPNYRPPVSEISRPDTAEGAPARPAPPKLSELVQAIPVTVWMPAKQTFFVGDRAFHVGDRFPLRTSEGKLINVEVTSMTATAIMFRDVVKGEVVTLHREGPKTGIQRGTVQEPPPGVVVPNPSAPLDLQPAETPKGPPNR